MPLVQEIKVPLLAVNDTELTVVDILFSYGDAVKNGDIVLVFESSKTTYDVVAEADGYIQYTCEAGNAYEVNTPVAMIYSSKEELPPLPEKIKPKTALSHTPSFTAAEPIWEGSTQFSAAAIALMRTHNMATDVFAGKDFVSRAEVEQKLGIGPQKNLGATSKNKASDILPVDLTKVTLQKISSAKKREIEYLSSVQQTGLISTVNTMVETDGLFVHLNTSLQFLKGTLLPVIIYETARLLAQFKPLNAYYTGDAVAWYNDVNIGFAVDINKGLKVLKMDNAASKTVQQIENDILQLSDKYLDDKLLITDLTEITFTITDLSAEKVNFFVPLVNMMNSAILGVSSIDDKTERCMLSLTFDHRVTEGKTAAQFLAALKERLESYRSAHTPLLNQNITCFKCLKTLAEDISDTGFSCCITPKGEEAYICQSCFKGF